MSDKIKNKFLSVLSLNWGLSERRFSSESIPPGMRRFLMLYPFLFAIFPSLSLFSVNVGEVSATDLILPLVLVTLATCLILVAVGLILRSKTAAGILTSVFWLLFFSFGHFYRFFEGAVLCKTVIGTPKYAVLIWVVLYLACSIVLLVLHRSYPRQVTRLLNNTAVMLVVIPVIISIVSLVGFKSGDLQIADGSAPSSVVAKREYPDIYYIILDAYGRDDVLKELYGYDNSGFLAYLKEKGFFVAHQSRANYTKTSLSLASSLNMTYLDQVAETIQPHDICVRLLIKMIKRNEVSRYLKARGYVDVAFSSGSFVTELIDATYYLHPSFSLSEFHQILLNSTPVPLVLEKISDNHKRSSFVKNQYDLHRERILFVFENLSGIPELKKQVQRPLFVFAHILAPHYPFVFDATGNPVNPSGGLVLGDHDGKSLVDTEEYILGYVPQLIFINSQVKKTIDQILEHSPSPPVIIIQADHGPRAFADSSYWKDASDRENEVKTWERLGILNAIYIPNSESNVFYSGISPVNSFRLLFNHLFDEEFEQLEDRSYMDLWAGPLMDILPGSQSGE